MKETNLKRLHTVWLQPHDIMGKSNYGDSEQIGGCQEWGGEKDKRAHRAVSEHWNYSVWYCGGGHMSSFLCEKPLGFGWWRTNAGFMDSSRRAPLVRSVDSAAVAVWGTLHLPRSCSLSSAVNLILFKDIKFIKNIILPWLAWLRGLSAGLRTERLPGWFPVRPHARVAGQGPR